MMVPASSGTEEQGVRVDHDGRPARRSPSVPLGELVFAGIMVALGVFAVVGIFLIHVPVGMKAGPTVFPIFVSVILLASAVAVLIGVLRGSAAVRRRRRTSMRACRPTGSPSPSWPVSSSRTCS